MIEIGHDHASGYLLSPANPANVDQVDTSYPGIVLKYENGYLH